MLGQFEPMEVPENIGLLTVAVQVSAILLIVLSQLLKASLKKIHLSYHETVCKKVKYKSKGTNDVIKVISIQQSLFYSERKI